MMRRTADKTFRHDQPARTGILLTNLGTPDEPTAVSVRRYLAEFLSDSRVIEIPKPLWWLILHGIILPTRPKKVAEKYQQIWTEKGSPLLAIGQEQAAKVQQQLDPDKQAIVVALAMRYGNPSIPSVLNELRVAGVRRLLIFPLYPQYSAATTASTFDAVAKELRTWRWLPELRMINHYHDYPAYIEAIASSIKVFWRSQEQASEKLLFSFHGMPKATLLAGDPYHCECQKTARLVAEKLSLSDESWAVAFQSRFGRAEWLKPYTSELLQDWAKTDVKSVDVICPGFSADCLETLEEIQQENRDYFREAGGELFRYIPALNDSIAHIDALVEIIGKHIEYWHSETTQYSPEGIERAIAMGAVQ